MKFALAALVIAIVILAGCVAPSVSQQNSQVKLGTEGIKKDAEAAGMVTAQKGDTVEVDYVGKLVNGTVFDTSIESEAKAAALPSRGAYAPLRFTVGAGQMIQGFDEAVVDMKVGQTKTVTLAPEKAYGPRDNESVITVPIENINGGQVEVGMQVSAGNAHGVVSAVNSTTATIDFNHELAGKTLVFTIKMVKIEKKA